MAEIILAWIFSATNFCPAPLRTSLGVDGIIDIIRQCAGPRHQQDTCFVT
jgi:hypothetical protein